MLDVFGAAMAASAEGLPGTELVPQRLAAACAEALPVAAAGLSLYFAPGQRVPLGASDEKADQAERLQYTAGEGPCLTAHAEQRPVLADEAELTARWPVFAAELMARTPIRGVIALPLGDGHAQTGVLDLYVVPPGQVDDLSLADALAVTAEVARVFAHPADSSSGGLIGGPAWLGAPGAQRRIQVWQAMGLLNTALRLDSVDALAALRGYAYSRATDVDTVAGQVVDGTLAIHRLAPGADDR